MHRLLSFFFFWFNVNLIYKEISSYQMLYSIFITFLSEVNFHGTSGHNPTLLY